MKSISIHLTDTCNNSCRFCVVDSHQGSVERVDQAIVHRFLERNAGKGYEAVNFHGGEPTLIPELPGILDKIRELGYSFVSLQTNGRLLKDLEFARTLADKGVELFIISLHGKDAGQHDFLTRVEGSFDEAVQGIKNSKKLGKKVRTNTVLCKQNYNDLAAIVHLAVALGADHINISNIHTTGRAYANFHDVVPRLSDTVPVVKKVVRELAAHNRKFTLEGFPPCCLDGYGKYMKSWKNSEAKVLYRRSILVDYERFMEDSSRLRGDVCRACTRKDGCGGVYKEYIEFYGWDEFQSICPQPRGMTQGQITDKEKRMSSKSKR